MPTDQAALNAMIVRAQAAHDDKAKRSVVCTFAEVEIAETHPHVALADRVPLVEERVGELMLLVDEKLG